MSDAKLTEAERNAVTLFNVLTEHRFMARNAAGRMGCRGCTWTGTASPGTDLAWAEFAEHVADAQVAALFAGTATRDEAADKAEHVGGCNDRCQGNSHWLVGAVPDLSAVRGLTSFGAQAGTINGRPYIWQDQLTAAVVGADRDGHTDNVPRRTITGTARVSRNRASAKKAGTSWESEIVRTLIDHGWPHAERRRLAGSKDRGDIAGVPGICIEAKNTKSYDLAGAVTEANAEALNASVPIGVAWIKRHGKTSPLDGYVVCDGATFLRLIQEGSA